MRKKTKNLLVIIVLLAIIGIGVGYAALSQQLVLTGTATLSGANSWKVRFKNSSCHKSVSTTTIANDATMDINSDLLTGTFSATLAPGETATFDVGIENLGAIPAKFDGVTVTEINDSGTAVTNPNAYITCTVVTKPAANAVLDPVSKSADAEHKYTVVLTCADVTTLPTTDETAKFKVEFNYSQN